MAVQYNVQTGMLDVFAETGELIGAVPSDRQGRLAADDAILAHALIGERGARRVVVLVGGTPNISPIRRDRESWETSVVRHQRQLGLARASQADARARAREVA